jgi:hypothetical protein
MVTLFAAGITTKMAGTELNSGTRLDRAAEETLTRASAVLF